MATKPGAGKAFAAALVLGVIAAVLVYQWASDLKKHSKENWKPIVTATVEIKPHTKITKEMIQTTHVPDELIADNVATNLAEVEGRVSNVRISPKAQVRRADLAQAGNANTLAVNVPAGMRAIAIDAGEIAAVGKSVKPDDHIDIMATFHDPQTKQDLTKIVLQNVRVLAINCGDTDPASKAGADTSMTIALKPEDAELVTAASRAGALRVMLRAVNDDKIIASEGTTVRDLGSGKVMLEAPKTQPTETVVRPVAPPPVRQRSGITIIRGTQEQVVETKE